MQFDRFAAERQRRLFSARVVGSNGVALNRMQPLAIGGDEAVAASAFTEDDRAASDVYHA